MALAKNKTILPVGDRGRAIFNTLKANPAYNNKIVQPSFLRAEAVLKNGKAVYDFSLIKDTNSDSITERKLDRNDRFVITHLGLYLAHRVVGREGMEQLVTGPNFMPEGETNNGKTYQNKDLWAVYQGSLAVTVGQTKFLEGIDTMQFLYEPEFMSEANSRTMYGFDTRMHGFHRDNGMIELTPQITLDGSQKNNIQLVIPVTSETHVEAVGTIAPYGPSAGSGAEIYLPCQHLAVLMARGYLITNK